MTAQNKRRACFLLTASILTAVFVMGTIDIGLIGTIASFGIVIALLASLQFGISLAYDDSEKFFLFNTLAKFIRSLI
jgi:predicted membrane metal-binding protein